MKFTGERLVPELAEGEIRTEHIHRYSYIADLMKGKVVLDAACGDGYGADILAETAAKVYGIDISEEAVDNAKIKYKKSNLEFHNSSIDKLPFEDASFDAVVSFETIEHVDEETQISFMKEIKRVLKSDGLLIISTPNKLIYSDIVGYRNQFHLKEFYLDEFNDFLKSYFLYVNLFSQGFEKYNVISSMKDNSADTVNIIYQDYNTKQTTYIIAVCSDKKAEILDNVRSINYCGNLYQSYLYLDYGEGFSEENKINAIILLNGIDFVVEFILPDKGTLKALRWDPVEGYFCKVRIEKIALDKGYISVKSSNAMDRKEGFDIFTTRDPIYELEGDYRNALKLRIEGKIGFFSSIELYEKINEVEQHNKYIMDKNVELAEDIKKIKLEFDNLMKEKTWLQESYELNLMENKKIHEYYESISQEKELLLQNNSKITEELLALQKEYNNMNEKILRLEMDLDKINRENSDIKEKYSTLLIERDEIRDILNTTISSASWKITKPLRVLKKLLIRKETK